MKKRDFKNFSWAVWHFLALYFEFGIKFSALAVSLNFGINLAVANDFILQMLLKMWIFFVSEMHYIWYFRPKTVSSPMHWWN